MTGIGLAPVIQIAPNPWHHESIIVLAPDPSLLIKRVQQGDQDAFGDLYDTLAPTVFGAVKRVLRDPAMSEEVTQEVFVELWRTADRFDSGRATVQAWAVTIARRRAVDRVRREQSQRNRIEDLSRQPQHDVDEPGESVVASLDAERLGRAMLQLPDDQRIVLELAFIEGHAHGAIAELLDLPLGTVKGRVRGGLKRLRHVLEGTA